MLLSAGAKPYAFSFDPTKTALLLSQYTKTLALQGGIAGILITIASLVDFQRDFLEDGGFGEVQGGNLTAVQESVKPAAAVLKLARRAGLTVIHTREGHEPGLRDCPTCKVSPTSFI
jgi:Isochorismatase family